MKIEAFPDKIDISPESYRELALVKNFRNPRSGVSLNVDAISLVREANKRLSEWIDEEQGRFENVEANITTRGGSLMPFYLDIQQITRGLERSEVGIKARKSEGHFFENADFLTFELLHSKGFLPDSLFVKVPYIVVPDDVGIRIIFVTAQTLALTYQLIQATFEIAKSIAAFSDALGTGVITAVLQLAALIVFFVLTVVALIQALKTLRELIFPKLRYLKAISDYNLINQGCKYLGYDLQSEELKTKLSQAHTLPIPQAQEGTSVWKSILMESPTGYMNKGYPTGQDSTPTLGSLIQYYLDTYNLKCFVYDGVVKLEKRRYFKDTATVKIIPTLTNQSGHTDEWTYNDDEVWGRTYDHWQVDYTDLHSPDTSDGIQFEAVTEQKNTINSDLVRLTGLRENSAPFSLGSRKNDLNVVEKAFVNLFKLFDKVIGAFGGNPVSSQIQSRKGILVIEKEYFAVTKKLWGTPKNGELRQAYNYKDMLSMAYIYENYKTDLEVNNNNYKVKSMRIPFTDENFKELIRNNFVMYEDPNTPTTTAEVVSIEYYESKYSAEIIILVPDKSAFNTKTTYIT